MNIPKSLKQWAAYRRTIRTLEQLDNHLLDDLGINRSDIHRIARGRASSL